ncbi:MAG: sugar transferase, partial [Planctomycetes bacterium]|nr:sugar transferase [Planctomycetota bacterium]
MKENIGLIHRTHFIIDCTLVAIAWYAAYYLRFGIGLFAVTKEVPSVQYHNINLIIIMVIWFAVSNVSGLYQMKRIVSRLESLVKISLLVVFMVLIYVTVNYWFFPHKTSRLVLIVFSVLVLIGLCFTRLTLISVMRKIFSKGKWSRKLLMVGDGELGRKLVKNIQGHPEIGFDIRGYLIKDGNAKSEEIEGIPVLGAYQNIREVLASEKIQDLILALPLEEQAMAIRILEELDTEMVEIMFIPEIARHISLWGGVLEFDEVPIINLCYTPLHGYNRLFKRMFDIGLSVFWILATLPLQLVIAAIIKLTSRGPVIYKQERMGLDGLRFDMYKFRSMKTDAEQTSGPVWASSNDDRRTWIG